MKMHLLILLGIYCLCAACNHQPMPANPPTPAVEANADQSADIIPHPALAVTLDTTIILSNLEQSDYRGKNLTEKLAKRVLYQYFTDQGHYTQDNLPALAALTEEDEGKMCVDYDTLFLADLNGSKRKDAIITYWLAPPYGSSHCYQPHRAIIADTRKGYKITNEEFIPAGYIIDSVITKNGQVTIWGYDYECANHRVLRNLKIKIK